MLSFPLFTVLTKLQGKIDFGVCQLRHGQEGVPQKSNSTATRHEEINRISLDSS